MNFATDDPRRHLRPPLDRQARQALGRGPGEPVPRSGGGQCYGYRVGAQTGARVIVKAEAAVVLRVFEEYAAGSLPREIAERLNADGVKPPRNGHWTASTITGNPARGNGILRNPLYDGRQVWNRVSMRKDPRTGRRVSRPNPASEWVESAVPELRIVPAELYARARNPHDR